MARPLKKVGKDASVHPATLKKVEPYKPRRPKRPRSVRTTPVIVRLDLRLHRKDVVTVALSLAEGDIYRIEQVGTNDLIVHNTRNWRYLK